MKEEILEAIKKLREVSKKRNFVQTVDLIINLQYLDVRRPENRINEVLELPHGTGKEVRIVVFSDSLKDLDVPIITSAEIEKIASNKREAKKLARNTDFFLAEPSLMPVIGKHLGRYLAPRGKMPKVISGEVEKMIESLRKSVRLRIKDSPVIQCKVGSEDMEDEKIAENIEVVLRFLAEKLPKGKNNIKNVLVKMTMSKPVKVEVRKW